MELQMYQKVARLEMVLDSAVVDFCKLPVGEIM